MKKRRKDPDLAEQYDFSRGVRGKYAKRYAERTNVSPQSFKEKGSPRRHGGHGEEGEEKETGDGHKSTL